MPDISKSFINALVKQGAPDQVTYHWDDKLTGFAVRHMPSGLITYLFRYRAGKGREAPIRKVALGRHGTKLTPDQARTAAEAMNAKVTMARDPVAEVKAHVAQAKVAKQRAKDDVAKSYPAVLDTFAARHLSTIRTGAEVERAMRRHTLPRWQAKQADRISKADVIALIDDVSDDASPHAARLLRAYLSKLFTWCEQRDLVAVNPIRGTAKPVEATQRDRVLSDVEMEALWATFEAMPYPWSHFLKVLLLTAQRRDEVASMRWDDLNLGAGVWTIARESTKADRSHEVPLSPAVIEVLSSIERFGDHVFTTNGRSWIQGFSPLKKRIDASMAEILAVRTPQSKVGHWVLHDLRRTAATYMGRNGVQRDAITLTLNHSLPGITAIYDRAGRLPEKRHALDTWARVLTDIVTPTAVNVVPIRRA
jgi:integrase